MGGGGGGKAFHNTQHHAVHTQIIILSPEHLVKRHISKPDTLTNNHTPFNKDKQASEHINIHENKTKWRRFPFRPLAQANKRIFK